MFKMYLLRRPRRAGDRDGFEHRRRAATIKMRIPRRGAEDSRHIEHTTLLLVDMETQRSIAGSKLVEKRRFPPSPDRIV